MKYRREAWRTAEHPSRIRRIIFPFPKAQQRGDRIIRLHYITRIGSVRLHCKTNQYSLWPRWPQLLPRRQAAAQPGRAPGHAGTPVLAHSGTAPWVPMVLGVGRDAQFLPHTVHTCSMIF